jgi:predicted transcriptional regulator
MSYRISVSNVCKIESLTKYFDHEYRSDSDVVKLFGNGIFFSPFNKENNDYDRNGVSTSKVNFYLKQGVDADWDLEIHCYKTHNWKIEQLTIDVICEKSLYEKLEKFAADKNYIEITFNVIKWENFNDAENSFEFAKAKIEDIFIESKENSKSLALIDFEILDIENYLIRRNCLNSSGQIADICKEFAKSFKQVPSHVDKNRLINEIESLITSYRSTFHDHLHVDDKLKVAAFFEKYGFKLNPYSKNYALDFEKITDKKDRYEAIRIFNNLWSRKKAEGIFKNGFPIGSGDAECIADEYINLKYIYSPTCERILLDVLISCHIEEYANSAQNSNNISSNALQSIAYSSYKRELKLETKNSLVDLIGTLIGHLIGRVFSGLISWWISGLIAGNNETAHIILFGTMFAADTVLMGMYQNHKLKNDKNTESSVEEHYFNIIQKMCNLHYYSYFMDVKLMRDLLHQLSSNNVKFQHQIFQIISLIESRK